MFIGLLSACTIATFGESLAFNSERDIKYVCVKNRPYQTRLTLVDKNLNKTLFYPLNDTVNKCGGSRNTIDDPYAWMYVPSKVKYINVKTFNLMLGLYETRFLIQCKSYEYKCGFNKSVCNSNSKWNHDV